MNRMLIPGLALCLLSVGCAASGPEGLANEMFAAIEAESLDRFKAVAEAVQKLSQDDQKKFGEAFGKIMESKVGNDPVQGMAFMGKMFKTMGAAGPGGMPGMPGGGGFLGGPPGAGGGAGIFGGAPAAPGGGAAPGAGFIGK